MAGYRNEFEEKIAAQLGPTYEYETIKLPYVIPHTYTPDFIDRANKVIIEGKGRLTSFDRQKMIAVKKQNPDWTYIILFQNPNLKLYKGSKTSYAQWAEKHGFQWRTLNG